MQAMQIEPGQQMMGMMAGASPELQQASAKIQATSQVKVMQQRQILQAISCWEQQNRYLVFDGPTDQATPVFYVQEGTKCWERFCPCPECKPWRMTYYNIPPGAVANGVDPTVITTQYPAFLHIDRPMSATCLCFNRPEAIITELPSGRVIGKLRDPCALCNLTFQILDPSDQERLNSSTCICQKGLLCPCPGCTVNYPILDSKDGHQVAEIVKTWMWGDLCPLCCKDWDNNVITFGEAANPDYKMLLMTLATFIQMRYFDSRNQ